MSRYIDADALKASYIVTSTTTNSLCHLYVSIEDINSAPSIDIEPKRGEWIGTRISHYPGYECSLCHYGVQPWNTTRYCPNCGARMKGANDEEQTTL